MLKNVMLVASAATLLSCTAETYIEFDDLTLQINGLEIDSSVGIDGQSVNELVDNSSQQEEEVVECFDIDVGGIVNSFNSYPALGMTLEMYIDAVSSAFGMKDYFDGMSITRQVEWDDWGNAEFGGDRSIGHIKFDISGSDIDMVLIYDVNTKEYLMTIFFNTPEYWDSRVHFGVEKVDGKAEADNVFWFECENVAFNSAIEWIKNYLG